MVKGNGKIVNPKGIYFMEHASEERGADAVRLPGLIDLQVNGYRGVDFSGDGL